MNRDMRFYAFNLFLWTPFNVKGKFFEDPKDTEILEAKTTPAEFMYPMWLRAPLRRDPRRTGKPNEADLMVMTDSFVDVSPFAAKFVYHTMHPEKDATTWDKLEGWWSDEVQGEQSGRLVVSEAKRRLETLKGVAETERGGGKKRPVAEKPKWAYLLPSEWMFSHDVLADDLKLSTALTDVAGEDSMAAVTDFDDGGPSLAAIVTTVPFTVHSAIASELVASDGVINYAAKKRVTFFKGTGDRGIEGALKKLVSVRDSLRSLHGVEGHAVFVSSDDMTEKQLERHRTGPAYDIGMMESTYCWIPRGDNPTSRRIFDAVAAGCIPVVVSDDISRYLPFRWAIEWRSMILQVPEAVFNKDPRGVADAVLALPDKVVNSLRDRMDVARTAVLWNDRADPDKACASGKKLCSRAPRLYVDEMLHRVKTNNFAVDTPLCKPKPNDRRFNYGATWNAENTCPPWLKMKNLCS